VILALDERLVLQSFQSAVLLVAKLDFTVRKWLVLTSHFFMQFFLRYGLLAASFIR